MFATRVLSAAALFVSLAAALSLDAPTEWKQCERIQLVGKGKGSLNLAILHEDDECGDAVKEWLNVESATFNYTVPSSFTVGQKVLVLLEENDSDAEEWSKPITVVAGNCDGAAVPPADDNTNNFAGGSPSGSGTTVVTPAPTPTTGSGTGTNAGSGNGGAANVGSVPGSKDTDEEKDGAARAGVSVAFVVGAAVLAMAF